MGTAAASSLGLAPHRLALDVGRFAARHDPAVFAESLGSFGSGRPTLLAAHSRTRAPGGCYVGYVIASWGISQACLCHKSCGVHGYMITCIQPSFLFHICLHLPLMSSCGVAASK